MPEFIPLKVAVEVPPSQTFRDKFPLRSPMKVANALRKMIRGKTICDVGCGRGDLVLAFAKFASVSFGVNNDPKETRVARERGAEVLFGDALTMDLPPADFYFMYWDCSIGSPFIQRMMQNQPGSWTILASGRENQWFLSQYIEDWDVTQVYSFQYKEADTTDENIAPVEGTWWIVPIEKQAQ